VSAVDDAEWSVKLLTAQFERAAAVNELREALIEPSPADVENWLASTPRQRRRLMELWAIFNSSYTK
jgi:hypothetical protein